MNRPIINIEEKPVGNGNPVFIIAEIGTSHGAKVEKAFALIDAAAASGADCVKFQLVIAEEIIHPLSGEVKLPGGNIPLYERFKQLEVPSAFYERCKTYAKGKELVFLCTPFGIRSAQILERLGVSAYKIASPELNHFPLLYEVSKYRKPVILSSGVSSLGDIEKSLSITGPESVLLHCVTSYPAPEEEYNLAVIPNLASIFGVPAGVSDHSMDPVLVPALAASLGAQVIEKHITLSRDGSGLDDPVALDPASFKNMTGAVREARKQGFSKTYKKLSRIFGEETVRKTLGDGIKRVAPSEAANYLTTKRSIHAVRRINKGELITEENTALLRSEKNLKPGLFPEHHINLIGRKAIRNIPDGNGITWEDILP